MENQTLATYNHQCGIFRPTFFPFITGRGLPRIVVGRRDCTDERTIGSFKFRFFESNELFNVTSFPSGIYS